MSRQVLFGIGGDDDSIPFEADDIPAETLPFTTPINPNRNNRHGADYSQFHQRFPVSDETDDIPGGVSPESMPSFTPFHKNNLTKKFSGEGDISINLVKLREASFVIKRTKIFERVNISENYSRSRLNRLEKVLSSVLLNYILKSRLRKLHQYCSSGKSDEILSFLQRIDSFYPRIYVRYDSIGCPRYPQRWLSAYHIAILHNQLDALQALSPSPDVVVANTFYYQRSSKQVMCHGQPAPTNSANNNVAHANLFHFCCAINASFDILNYLSSVVSEFGLPVGQRALCQPSSNQVLYSGYLEEKPKLHLGFFGDDKARKYWVVVSNSGFFLRVDEYSRSFVDFFPLLPKKCNITLQRTVHGYVLKVKLLHDIVSTMTKSRKISFVLGSKELARRWHWMLTTAGSFHDIDTYPDAAIRRIGYIEQRNCSFGCLTDAGESMGHLLARWAIAHCEQQRSKIKAQSNELSSEEILAVLLSKFLWLQQQNVDMNGTDVEGYTLLDRLVIHNSSTITSNIPELKLLSSLIEFLTQIGCRRSLSSVSSASADSQSSSRRLANSSSSSRSATAAGQGLRRFGSSSDSDECMNSSFRLSASNPASQRMEEKIASFMEKDVAAPSGASAAALVAPVEHWLGYSYLNVRIKDFCFFERSPSGNKRKIQLDIRVYRKQERHTVLKIDKAQSIFVCCEKYSYAFDSAITIPSNSEGNTVCGTTEFTWTMQMPLECPFISSDSAAIVFTFSDANDAKFKRWAVVDIKNLIKPTEDIAALSIREVPFVLDSLGSYLRSNSNNSRSVETTSVSVNANQLTIVESKSRVRLSAYVTRLSGLMDDVTEELFVNRIGLASPATAIISAKTGNIAYQKTQIHTAPAVKLYGSHHFNPRVENCLPSDPTKRSATTAVHLKTLEYVDGEPSETYIFELPEEIQANQLIYRLGGRQDRTLFISESTAKFIRSLSDAAAAAEATATALADQGSTSAAPSTSTTDTKSGEISKKKLKAIVMANL